MGAVFTLVVFMGAASMHPRISKTGSIPEVATFIPTPAHNRIHRGIIRDRPAAAETILNLPMVDIIRIPPTQETTLIPPTTGIILIRDRDQVHIPGDRHLRPLAHIGPDIGVQLPQWHGARLLQLELQSAPLSRPFPPNAPASRLTASHTRSAAGGGSHRGTMATQSSMWLWRTHVEEVTLSIPA